jgi:hypothetical protein
VTYPAINMLAWTRKESLHLSPCRWGRNRWWGCGDSGKWRCGVWEPGGVRSSKQQHGGPITVTCAISTSLHSTAQHSYSTAASFCNRDPPLPSLQLVRLVLTAMLGLFPGSCCPQLLGMIPKLQLLLNAICCLVRSRPRLALTTFFCSKAHSDFVSCVPLPAPCRPWSTPLQCPSPLLTTGHLPASTLQLMICVVPPSPMRPILICRSPTPKTFVIRSYHLARPLSTGDPAKCGSLWQQQ